MSVSDSPHIKKITAYESLRFVSGRYMVDIEALVSAMQAHGVPPQAYVDFYPHTGSDDLTVTARWGKDATIPPISRDQLAVFPEQAS